MFVLVPVLLAASVLAHTSGTPACLRARISIAADSVPETKDFEPASCPQAGVVPAFRHDRNAGTTRLSRAIAAGDLVERFPEYGTQHVVPGQKLSLIVTRGPVQVRRTVTALQAAKPGQSLFVRSDDGQILSVEFEAAAP